MSRLSKMYGGVVTDSVRSTLVSSEEHQREHLRSQKTFNMRVTGKNFMPPVGCSKNKSESDSEVELGDVYWNGVLKKMFPPKIEFEDDPNPYELEEGYDASDPRFPDRRWRQRICVEALPASEEEEMWQEHLATYEKEPTFIIQPDEFDRDQYRNWLHTQRAHQQQNEVNGHIIDIDDDDMMLMENAEMEIDGGEEWEFPMAEEEQEMGLVNEGGHLQA